MQKLNVLLGFQRLALAGLMAMCWWSASGATLYVSDATNFAVKSYDGTTGAYLADLTVPGGFGIPNGLAVGANGTLYVADSLTGSIYKFDNTGAYVGTLVTGLSQPSGIAIGPDGDLYVADYGPYGYVNRYDITTGALVGQVVSSSAGSFGGLAYPRNLAFGPDGHLYIVDTGNGSVDRWDGSTLIQFTALGSPVGNLGSVAFGSDGNLYVVDITQSVVHRFSGTDGHLIDEFVPASSVLGQPTDLFFGPGGDLFVTDSLARVARFDGLTGAYLNDLVATTAGGLVNPTYMAFDTGVPEPSTWILMLTGLCVAVFWKRRLARTWMLRFPISRGRWCLTP